MPADAGSRKWRLEKVLLSYSKRRDVLRELIEFWACYAERVNSFIAAYQQTEGSE